MKTNAIRSVLLPCRTPFSLPKALLFVLLAFTSLGMLYSQSRIVFAEAQMAGSWESLSRDFRPYTMHPHEAMQRPSVGFDLVQRLGGEGNDWGYLAIQARLAYDDIKDSRLEAQLFNAFLNLKTSYFDAWIGHNKPALGLSYTRDNHAQIIMDNSISGLVLDRDWGIGLSMDRWTPELNVSLTTGSGMALYQDKSWLLATRAALGNFDRDNYSLGASFATGNIFKTMGYNIMHNKVPHKLLLGGVDFSRRIMNWEIRSDALYGSFHDKRAYTALLRMAWYPLLEDRAELAVQSQIQEVTGISAQNYSVGVGYRISPDFTIRSAYTLQKPSDSQTLALQLYFLKALPF